MSYNNETKTILGWREWLSLPDLSIPAIKAKIDTGAKTSALHAFAIEAYTEDDIEMVCFKIHPLQKRQDIVISCVAPVIDQRLITDSGGHQEMRYVIRSCFSLGNYTLETEFTLTDRDTMRFKLLLGRRAMTRYIVDPSASYLQGKMPISPY